MKILWLVFFMLFCPITNYAQNIKAEVDTSTKKWGFKKGDKWILSPNYSFASWDEDSKLGMICKDNYESEKKAIVNQNGKVITDFDYSSAETIYFEGIESMSNMITVHKKGGNLWGVIDRNGKTVVPCIYSLVFPDHHDDDSWFLVRIDNKYGLLHADGSNWIEPKYANYLQISPFGNYFFANVGGKSDGAKTTGGKWGVINGHGEEIVPCIYDNVQDGGWMKVATDSLLFAVNKGGSRDEFGNTLGGKWGLYTNGKEIVPCQYDEAPKFWHDNETITIKKDGKEVSLRNPFAKANSDVDENIPVTSKTVSNSFAIIIGNEKYADETDVLYAENDARVFKEYCIKTLGIADNHIRYITNAGYNDMRKAVNWLKQGLEAYGGEGSAIIYYAGHGIPDEAQKTAYILPVDGIGSDIGSAYSLEKLYQTLGDMPAKNIVVFLDACFSGAKRDGGMMTSARGVAIKTKTEEPKGNMVVFSAAQNDETAYPYKSQQHGMFTYFLLRKLQETKGNSTLGELSEYIIREVKRHAFDENNRSQTPLTVPSQALTNGWKKITLK